MASWFGIGILGGILPITVDQTLKQTMCKKVNKYVLLLSLLQFSAEVTGPKQLGKQNLPLRDKERLSRVSRFLFWLNPGSSRVTSEHRLSSMNKTEPFVIRI